MPSIIRSTRIAPVLLIFFVLLGLGAAYAGAAAHPGAAPAGPMADIARDPADLPGPIGNRGPTTVQVSLTAVEVNGQLDPASGTTYRYWTFNGKVPGPMIRVRQGDTVVVTLHNDAHSHMVHSVDFHAALGPGGGAAYSQALPGHSKTITFVATRPGLYVYHCGTPMIAEHIANGMYGLILVEPPQGLAPVDHEYYLMQGEIYTVEPRGKAGWQQFSAAKLMQETPEYFIFNGAVDAVTKQHPMRAKVGETVRVFFGDAGPNKTASIHAVGEIFSREYPLGSLTSTALTDVQTAEVPSGGAAVLELKAAMPGQFSFMDHSISRMAKGSMATLDVSGQDTAHLMYPDATEGEEAAAAAVHPEAKEGNQAAAAPMSPAPHSMMAMAMPMPPAGQARTARHNARNTDPAGRLDGCLVFDDNVARLRLFHSTKTYRLDLKPGLLNEHPLLIAQNVNALVELGGRPAGTVATGDRLDPLFTVDNVQQLSPTCDTDQTLAQLREQAGPHPARAAAAIPEGAATVGMSDLVTFVPATVTIHAGQSVVWKNTSVSVHNVVDDVSQATNAADVHLPAGAKPFDSGYMQPGQAYARTFPVPGIYRYVCTLHESSGMKGVVIVK